VAADAGWLLWNHGGSGDDVEAAHPGHIVSILTPTSRYAEPFLRKLAASQPDTRLCLAHGRGSFGKQVVAGAEVSAARLGIETYRINQAGELPSPGPWNLFSAGSFEEDVAMVSRARSLPNPPGLICAVAAGVREFSEATAADIAGVFGVGQWFPGVAPIPDLGPDEAGFLAAYSALSGGMIPDYPAVQAAAGAVVAAHCARLARGSTRAELWQAASVLDARTLFGGFKINTEGTQVSHEAALVRWAADGPMLS
jgi:hypothetical protein